MNVKPSNRTIMRTYYGFRYYDGRDTRFADTGRIAGELVAFESVKKRASWLYDEDLYSQSMATKGERICIPRKRAIKICGDEEVFSAQCNLKLGYENG